MLKIKFINLLTTSVMVTALTTKNWKMSTILMTRLLMINNLLEAIRWQPSSKRKTNPQTTSVMAIEPTTKSLRTKTTPKIQLYQALTLTFTHCT